MKIIDIGQWGKAYRADIDGIAIARYDNDAGDDWYKTVAHNPRRPRGFCIGLDANGIVTFIGDDLEQMNPSGLRVLVLPDFPADPEARRAVLMKRFDFKTREFVDVPPPWADMPYPSLLEAVRDLLKRIEVLEARDGSV